MPGFDGKGPDGRGPTGGRRGPCTSDSKQTNSDKDGVSLAETFRRFANRIINEDTPPRRGRFFRRRNR